MQTDQSNVTVTFPQNVNGQGFVENLHAVPLGHDLYCVDNSPFYIYGVSLADIVHAPINEGRPVFLKVIEHRGHSTYRVRLPTGQNHHDFTRHWKVLEQLGCSFEGSEASTRRLYSIDVPPDADILPVYKVLEDGEEAGWWAFEEVHYFDRA